MNDVTLPGLIVPVEARIDRLERALKKASTSQARFASTVEARTRQSATRMAASYDDAGNRISATFRRIALPFAGGFLAGGVTALAGSISTVVKGIAQIGDEAKRAGVNLEAFQEWRYVAEANRIPIDALTDGFKELNLRADEFILTGGGTAAEAFKRIGFNAEELKGKLEDPSSLMLEIIGRLEGMDEAAQIRITDELFGGSAGERFVALLSQGEDGIRRTIAQARNLGAVLDAETIAKADALDRKFAAIGTRLQSLGKSFAVGLAENIGFVEDVDRLMGSDRAAGGKLGADLRQALAENGVVLEAAKQDVEEVAYSYDTLQRDVLATTRAIGGEIPTILEAGTEQATRLALELDDVTGQMEQLIAKVVSGEQPADTLGAQMTALIDRAREALTEANAIDNVNLDGAVAQVDTLSAALSRTLAWAGGVVDKLREAAGLAPVVGPVGGGRGDGNAEVVARAADAAARLASAPRTRPQRAPNDIDFGLPDPVAGGGGSGSGDRFGDALVDLQAETRALELEATALIAAAAGGREFGDAVEFAKTKADLLNKAIEDGKQITPELESEIDAIARAYMTAGQSAEEAAEKLKRIEEAGKKGADVLTDLFVGVATGAMTAKEALAQLLQQILKAQLSKFATSLFANAPAGGLLSGLGGLLGFAAGGFTGPGGTHEPAGIVHRGEFVMSKVATSRIGVNTLDGLHTRALKGYANGGLVGGGMIARTPSGAPVAAAQTININAPVTVNATGGTPEANADLARQVSKQIEGTMRRTVIDELARQTRPGNMLAR